MHTTHTIRLKSLSQRKISKKLSNFKLLSFLTQVNSSSKSPKHPRQKLQRKVLFLSHEGEFEEEQVKILTNGGWHVSPLSFKVKDSKTKERKGKIPLALFSQITLNANKTILVQLLTSTLNHIPHMDVTKQEAKNEGKLPLALEISPLTY